MNLIEPIKLIKEKPCPRILFRCADASLTESAWKITGNVAPAFKSVTAKPLVAYTPFEVLEGDGRVLGVVLFEFSSMEEARRWYRSAAYQEVKKLRDGAADFDLILVDGGVVSAAGERMPGSHS